MSSKDNKNAFDHRTQENPSEPPMSNYNNLSDFLGLFRTGGARAPVTSEAPPDASAPATDVSAPSEAPWKTIQQEDRYAVARQAAALRIEAQRVRSELAAKVLGQDDAIDMLADGLLRAQLVSPQNQGPKGVLLFIGPAGTGKTLAAQTLTSVLDDYQLLVIDLSALTNENQSNLIDGNESSYSNATPGLLTSHVTKHPKTVVLFKNIERCHPLVLARLNGLLASGQLQDQFGLNALGEADPKSRLVTDFSQTYLIFSTSAGDAIYDDPAFQRSLREQPTHAESMLLEELAKLPAAIQRGDSSMPQFTTAMLNHWRGGRVALFKALSLNALEQIARRAVADYARTLQTQLGFTVHGHTDGDLLRACLLSYAPQAGANEAARALPNQLFAGQLDQMVRHPVLPESVTFRFSPAAKTQWTEVVQLLTHDNPDADLLERCNRRGLKLDIGWEISKDASNITISQVQLVQVKTGSDLRGPGAIKIEVPAISFDKIAGHLIVKQRMQEVVAMLRKSHDPALRALIPTGMLLYGPPGTGKTMLAKALAHEADLPFISTTGTELANIDLMRAIFARARKYAPSIVFIDELDALGRRDNGGATRTINQLLTEMDGFDSAMGGMVFVIAATNLPEHIDPALRRAGRLDLHLEVPPLDPPARGFFVDRILALPVAPDVQREQLIRLTVGMSGAELERLKRELQLAHLRSGQAHITSALLLETLNTLRYGQRSTRPLSEEYQAHTAIHEAGHAVMNRLLNPDRIISHISIVPRARFSGFVAYDSDSAANRRHTLQEVVDDLCVLLAGRNAQEKAFGRGEADDGASSDLATATRLALAAVGQWGLVPSYGLLALGDDAPQALQQAASTELLAATRQLLNDADQRCRQLLDEHWPKVQQLQQRLLADEFILGNDW